MRSGIQNLEAALRIARRRSDQIVGNVVACLRAVELKLPFGAQTFRSLIW